jgi:hypothetical protein
MGKEMDFSIQEEFKGLNFKSKRLENRFMKTMDTFSKRPDKSIWLASSNRAEAKAIYRMLVGTLRAAEIVNQNNCF